MKRCHTIDSLGLDAMEQPKARRGDFPRYLLMVDGQTLKIETRAALAKKLASIYSEPPAVFVNCAGGLTVNFEN